MQHVGFASISNPWLAKLMALRSAPGRTPGRGVAPHKALLLICLFDLADENELPRAITRTASLALRFRAYGTLVSDRWPTRLDLRLPFYHLKSQGFWRAVDIQNNPAASPKTCVAVELDHTFHAAMLDPVFRLEARLVLTNTYFTPTERIALLEAMGLSESHSAAEQTDQVIASVRENAKRKGRSARFQIGVVDGYYHTCALTGYRCVTEDGATVVDAAHIDGWAESQNDELTNGLALSKTAHWMFDEGLWSVDDNLCVVVAASDRFSEAGSPGFQLRAFSGRELQFHPTTKLRPDLELLRAHRYENGLD
ncbi:MAG: hypothetical protein C0518_10425 [Opitutus sp.]|nr:hypothetical protein [Opitutus sp.]